MPIVFVQIVDPVGSGMVASLAHPGGNATGFSTIDYGACGKWLKLLKEIAPDVERVAVFGDHTTSKGFRPVGRNPGVGTIIPGGIPAHQHTRR